jgi:hypothetical protein
MIQGLLFLDAPKSGGSPFGADRGGFVAAFRLIGWSALISGVGKLK